MILSIFFILIILLLENDIIFLNVDGRVVIFNYKE
jgi:hypothetical protein